MKLRLIALAVGLLVADAVQAAPTRPARNVILFIGDGMGVSTITAARLWAQEAAGRRDPNVRLSFERLPQTAFSATYAADNLVTDSAAGATALLAGVKTDNGVVGLSAEAKLGDCASAAGTSVRSLGEAAAAAGLAVGVVTDARITDATPAALYGHSPNRDWERPADLPAAAKAQGCVPLAAQLARALTGALRLAFGGGASAFPGAAFTRTGDELDALKPGRKASYLGLFAPGNFPFVLDRAPAQTPTLAQMATKAVDLLAAEPRGYVLLIEAGLIDKAHHLNDAERALAETVELSKAVEAVLAKVDLSETLVVVTADHGHSLTLSGPIDPGAPLLGPARHGGAPARDLAGRPYPILGYATGPGAIQLALTRLEEAEHSGEDVAVFAAGPGADGVHGAMDNTDIHAVMARALGLAGPNR